MKDRIGRWASDKKYVEARPAFNVESFLVLGSFFAAIDGEGLALRLPPAAHEEALQLPGARPWRAGPPGRPTYVWIPADALVTDTALHGWLDRALEYVGKLPPKERLITKGVHMPEWKRGEDGGRG